MITSSISIAILQGISSIFSYDFFNSSECFWSIWQTCLTRQMNKYLSVREILKNGWKAQKDTFFINIHTIDKDLAKHYLEGSLNLSNISFRRVTYLRLPRYDLDKFFTD